MLYRVYTIHTFAHSMDNTISTTAAPVIEIFTRENAIAISKLLPRNSKAKIAKTTGHNKGTVSAVLNGNVGNYKSDTSKKIIKAALKLLKETEKDIQKEREELRKIIG